MRSCKVSRNRAEWDDPFDLGGWPANAAGAGIHDFHGAGEQALEFALLDAGSLGIGLRVFIGRSGIGINGNAIGIFDVHGRAVLQKHSAGQRVVSEMVKTFRGCSRRHKPKKMLGFQEDRRLNGSTSRCRAGRGPSRRVWRRRWGSGVGLAWRCGGRWRGLCRRLVRRTFCP